MHKKRKGDIAELAVATYLTKEGWEVLFPYGDRLRYDLVAEKDGQFLRIQVKYVTPKNGRLAVNCRSSNNWSVKSYTSSQIDFIAAYDANSEQIYFLPATELNANLFTIRINPAKNGQKRGLHAGVDLSSIYLKKAFRVPPLDKIPRIS